MPRTAAQKRAETKYRNKHIKRVPLDLQLEFFDQVKQAAEAAGESVNGFIKRAIMETAENDKRKRELA